MLLFHSHIIDPITQISTGKTSAAKMARCNMQEFYVGMHFNSRKELANNMHKYLYDKCINQNKWLKEAYPNEMFPEQGLSNMLASHVVTLSITYFKSDNRAVDSDNVSYFWRKFFQDMLVERGIISTDSSKVIKGATDRTYIGYLTDYLVIELYKYDKEEEILRGGFCSPLIRDSK